jgi:iron-sulfur cluster assembly accessory protein
MSEVTQTAVVSLTDAASSKVRDLLLREDTDNLALRIAVAPGGCSGLRYELFFDDRTLDGDVRAESGGVAVVTDKMSAPYLTGASIDYLDTLERSGFTIDNPNAKGSCACGESFH